VLVPPGLDVASLLPKPAAAAAPATTASTATTVATSTTKVAAAAGGKTIVDIAAGDGRFKTLVTAVKAAGLDGVLSGPGTFTVFAPTDAAFNYLDPNLLASLLKPENKATLASILTYHVLPIKLLAKDIASAPSHRVKTVNGKEVVISLKGGARVNDSSIIITDIEASNGVIHVIDTVLIPPAG
jgi:transforming growth factor-beta-induced protein